MPRVNGHDVTKGSLPADALEIPFQPWAVGKYGGGAGVFIETDQRDKRALLYFDTATNQLKVEHDGVTYTIGP